MDDEVELLVGGDVGVGVGLSFGFPEVGGVCELGDYGDVVVCEVV